MHSTTPEKFRIQVQQRELLKVLSVAVGISDSRLSSGVAAIKLIATQDCLELLCKNELLRFHYGINSVTIDAGQIVVEAAVLLNIIKTLENQVISIFLKNDMIYIQGDAQFKINQLRPDYFHNGAPLSGGDSQHIDANQPRREPRYANNDSTSTRNTSSNNQDNTNGNKSIGKFEITRNDLVRMLKSTKFSICSDESRQSLNCLAVKSIALSDPSQGAKIVAYSMDGHRFSKFELALQVEGQFQVLIPPKLIDHILTISGLFDIKKIDVQISNTSMILCFKTPNIVSHVDMTLESKLVNAEFIDYVKVVPSMSEYNTHITSNAAKMHESISRVTAISSEKFKAIKCEFYDDVVRVTAYGQNGAKATEEVKNQTAASTTVVSVPNANNTTATITHFDKPTSKSYTTTDLDADLDNSARDAKYGEYAVAQPKESVGFNYRYLLDVLDVLKGHTVKFSIKNRQSPIVITSDTMKEVFFIVMPIKI